MVSGGAFAPSPRWHFGTEETSSRTPSTGSRSRVRRVLARAKTRASAAAKTWVGATTNRETPTERKRTAGRVMAEPGGTPEQRPRRRHRSSRMTRSPSRSTPGCRRGSRGMSATFACTRRQQIPAYATACRIPGGVASITRCSCRNGDGRRCWETSGRSSAGLPRGWPDRRSVVVQGHLLPDHVHTCIEIRPSTRSRPSSGSSRGRVRSQSLGSSRPRNGTSCEHFWVRGYAVSTVGFNLEQVKAYLRAQEVEDQHDPF